MVKITLSNYLICLLDVLCLAKAVIKSYYLNDKLKFDFFKKTENLEVEILVFYSKVYVSSISSTTDKHYVLALTHHIIPKKVI